MLIGYLHHSSELQRKAAKLLGKEDALFVNSGTMGNLIASKNSIVTSIFTFLRINAKRKNNQSYIFSLSVNLFLFSIKIQ
jgi:hypothetical protein